MPAAELCSRHFLEQSGQLLQQFVKAEVTQCIVIADVFHHFSEMFHISRILTVCNHLSKEIAQNAAEVLMAGIAQEAATVAWPPATQAAKNTMRKNRTTNAVGRFDAYGAIFFSKN